MSDDGLNMQDLAAIRENICSPQVKILMENMNARFDKLEMTVRHRIEDEEERMSGMEARQTKAEADIEQVKGKMAKAMLAYSVIAAAFGLICGWLVDLVKGWIFR